MHLLVFWWQKTLQNPWSLIRIKYGSPHKNAALGSKDFSWQLFKPCKLWGGRIKWGFATLFDGIAFHLLVLMGSSMNLPGFVEGNLRIIPWINQWKKPPLKGRISLELSTHLASKSKGIHLGISPLIWVAHCWKGGRRLARSKRKSEITRPDINSTQILIGYHLTLRVSQQLSKPLKIKGGWSRRNFLLG